MKVTQLQSTCGFKMLAVHYAQPAVYSALPTFEHSLQQMMAHICSIGKRIMHHELTASSCRGATVLHLKVSFSLALKMYTQGCMCSKTIRCITLQPEKYWLWRKNRHGLYQTWFQFTMTHVKGRSLATLSVDVLSNNN